MRKQKRLYLPDMDQFDAGDVTEKRFRNYIRVENRKFTFFARNTFFSLQSVLESLPSCVFDIKITRICAV